MKQLVMVGFLLGVASVILAIISRFTVGHQLASVASLSYLDFANTLFLGSISLGVCALLQSRGGQ